MKSTKKSKTYCSLKFMIIPQRLLMSSKNTSKKRGFAKKSKKEEKNN
jgi:hypothetical protein